MAGNQLSHADFFDRLSALFSSHQGADPASILLTQKRLSYNTTPSDAATQDPLWDLHPPAPLPVIVRATNGKSQKHRDQKIKLATVVAPEELEAFYVRYAEVCRAGMTALRKRDRKGRKKEKRKKGKGGGEGEKKA